MIIAAAKILKHSCRSSDILSRWGGDEFIVLFTKTPENIVKKTVERIYQAFRGKSLDNTYPISISLGFATKNSKEQNIEKIIEAADSDMYKNKNENKRN